MSKYHAQPVTLHGQRFDSRKEAQRYLDLLLLQRAGEISDLERQVAFTLFEKSKYGRAVKYIADFTYTDRQGNQVIEDAKGYRTDVYKLKKRMMAELLEIEIKEV